MVLALQNVLNLAERFQVAVDWAGEAGAGGSPGHRWLAASGIASRPAVLPIPFLPGALGPYRD